MALNDLLCAHVPSRNDSLSYDRCVFFYDLIQLEPIFLVFGT